LGSGTLSVIASEIPHVCFKNSIVATEGLPDASVIPRGMLGCSEWVGFLQRLYLVNGSTIPTGRAQKLQSE
jgi:hypothetical protein